MEGEQAMPQPPLLTFARTVSVAVQAARTMAPRFATRSDGAREM